MEKDDEIHGATGTSYDFGARMYDPRIARFLSLDPLARSTPGWSPYVFALNNPIRYIDEHGKSGKDYSTRLNTMADAHAGQMNKAWKSSFNADGTVNEHGFNIFRTTTTITRGGEAQSTSRITRAGPTTPGTSGGWIDYAPPDVTTTVVKDGNVIHTVKTAIADFHTHPYSAEEGAFEGVCCSAGDVYTIRLTPQQDHVSFMSGGTSLFALVIEDKVLADRFFAENSDEKMQAAWDKAYGDAEGTFQERTRIAAQAVVGAADKSGLGFYQSDGKKDDSKGGAATSKSSIRMKLIVPICLSVLLSTKACDNRPTQAVTPTDINRSISPELQVVHGQEPQQSQSMIQDQLQSVIGLSVRDGLDQLSYKWRFVMFTDKKPGLLDGARFELNDTILVSVGVDSLAHMKAFNTNRNWALSDFLKERIARIERLPRPASGATPPR